MFRPRHGLQAYSLRPCLGACGLCVSLQLHSNGPASDVALASLPQSVKVRILPAAYVWRAALLPSMAIVREFSLTI